MFGERGGNGMEFKYRAVDAEAAHHPPPPLQRSYFTEQAIKAGYVAPCIGRIPENVQNPLLMQRLLRIELEKERIREEIIASEIAWRRLVEDEVRTQMILERKLTLQDGACNVFDRSSFLPVTGTRSRSSDLSFEQIEGRSLVERFGNGSQHEIGGHKTAYFEERKAEQKMGPGHEIISFQQRTFEPKIEVATLTSEVGCTKEKIVSMTKPEQNTFQLKRKSLTPPREGTTELPLIGVSKKKVKGEWSCKICNVNTTSECGLHDHFNGKKHKAKEVASAAQRNSKKVGIGIKYQKTAKDSILGATSNTSSTEQGEKSVVQLLDSKMAGDASLQKVKEVPPLVAILKNEQEAGGQLSKKGRRYKFWCEMCQVGAFSKTVMEAHRTGKKHVMRLEEARKHTTIPIPLMDSTEAKNAQNLTKM